MASIIRGKVSGNKRRFQEDGFDLDLTYITPRIIAMGFPSEKIMSVYRNPLDEVQRLFELKHKDRIKIYNLCSERRYDEQKFNNKVVEFPFDDHTVPPFEFTVKFCFDAQSWLNANPDKVVAVHCKAGKGRTGMMVSCLLMHLGLAEGALSALKYFGNQRTHDGKGVTIPSQMRWVHYYERYMVEGKPEPKSLMITKVVLITVPSFDIGGGCDPYVTVQVGGKQVLKTNPIYGAKNEPSVEISCGNVMVQGLVRLDLFDQDVTSSDHMGHVWFHTDFVFGQKVLIFKKDDIDEAVKDKKGIHFKPEFQLEVHLECNT